MIGTKIHGGLLAIALLLALQTWNREAPTEIELERILVWERDTSAVLSVTYRSSDMDLVLSRRSENDQSFWAGSEVSYQDGVGDPNLDTLVFPLGLPGGKLIEDFAEFRVLRDLGGIGRDRADEFGLHEPEAAVSIEFSDGAEDLYLGKTPVGSEDRYAWDSPEGSLYVIPADVIRPLMLGSPALRERQVHYFLASDVLRVRIEVDGRERVMVRQPSEIGDPAIWHPPGSSGQPDLTFANFMQRVSQVSIEGFGKEVSVDSLAELMRIEYFDEDDEEIGFLELYTESDESGDNYYILSERTKILAEAVKSLAEMVALDLTDIS